AKEQRRLRSIPVNRPLTVSGDDVLNARTQFNLAQRLSRRRSGRPKRRQFLIGQTGSRLIREITDDLLVHPLGLLAELFVAGSELQKCPRFHGAIGGLRSGDVLVQLYRGWEVALDLLLMQRFAKLKLGLADLLRCGIGNHREDGASDKAGGDEESSREAQAR